ncbi:MAG: sporulation initiation factor Spo0A C-terminal domain-containing protein [Oscillospiraceae bacterium]|nr:sporulation initiation factor Spo0A C-terminal domain-containing protein [Oscillospiraceae bacterium]
MGLEIEKNIESVVGNVLNLAKIPSNIIGYKYIIHAVELLLHRENKEEKIQIMKVYKQLSNEFGKTECSIEKAIRKSIEVCVIDEDIPELNKIFSGATLNKKDRITNKTFISLLVKNII